MAPRSTRQRRRGSALAIAVIALVCLALAATLITLIALRDKDRGDTAADLLAIKAQAERLAVDGRLREAHEKYLQLQQQAATRPITSDSVRQQLRQAREDQSRIYHMLVAAGPARSAPADTVPAPPPATLPQAVARVPEAPASPKPDVPLVPTTLAIAPVPPATTRAATAPAPPAPALALPPRPPPRPTEKVRDDLDERIGQSIHKGTSWLLERFERHQLAADVRASGVPRLARQQSAYVGGLNALCVYALLQAGQAVPDPRLDPRGEFVRGILSRLKDHPMDQGPVTYSRALRAAALAVHNRPEDRACLAEDVDYLLRASVSGAHTYQMLDPRVASGPIRWDNSNTQYGVLGVWAGAEAGLEIPAAYWRQVEQHWIGCQLPTGEWGYATAPASHPQMAALASGRVSMTLAGIASLFVTHDYLDAMNSGAPTGRPPFSPALSKALAWLETGDNAVKLKLRPGPIHAYYGYTLFSLERVGLASGFKYFGAHDWYRHLASEVIGLQQKDGAWNRDAQPPFADDGPGVGAAGNTGDLIETAYMLLFLSRGRHPILVNKLRFDGNWGNRPRDMANLARHASRELERPVNWQVVSFQRDWTDWMDCPLLYLASDMPPRLQDQHIDKMRAFVAAGGLLFTHADGSSDSFNRFAAELAHTLFPDYELRDLPTDHPLYTLNYKVEPRPKLRYVSNGSRILMLHSPAELALHWHARAEKTRKNVFGLGVNIFIYAAGKTDLRNRVDVPPPPPAVQPIATLAVARVKYPGNWDPEPQAWPALAGYLLAETGYGIDLKTVEVEDLATDIAPIAHFTGNAALDLTDKQLEALRRYVESGGTLLIDSCGGSAAFTTSITGKLLPRAFGNEVLHAMGGSHPVLAGKGAGMREIRLRLRPYAVQRLGAAARVEYVAHGKGRVIFSSPDLTTGLLGANTFLVLGYQPTSARELVRNILLWVWDGAPQKQN
mgnify:CR=1 FL=1